MQVGMQALRGGKGRGAWRCFALLPLLELRAAMDEPAAVQEVLAAAHSLPLKFLHVHGIDAASSSTSSGGVPTWRKTPTVHGDLQLRAANTMVRLPGGDAVPQESDVRFADFDWLPAVARLCSRLASGDDEPAV